MKLFILKLKIGNKVFIWVIQFILKHCMILNSIWCPFKKQNKRTNK